MAVRQLPHHQSEQGAHRHVGFRVIWQGNCLLAGYMATACCVQVPWHANRNKQPEFKPGNLTTYDTQPTSVSFQAQFSKSVSEVPTRFYCCLCCRHLVIQPDQHPTLACTRASTSLH